MPHPRTDVEKIVHGTVGYELRCALCGKEMTFYRDKSIPQHWLKHGWKVFRFCSGKCKSEARKSMNYEP